MAILGQARVFYLVLYRRCSEKCIVSSCICMRLKNVASLQHYISEYSEKTLSVTLS